MSFSRSPPTTWQAEEGASIRINPVERSAHSAGFVVMRGIITCGPPLTGDVRVQKLNRHEGSQLHEPFQLLAVDETYSLSRSKEAILAFLCRPGELLV